jgi:hypothetical protein
VKFLPPCHQFNPNQSVHGKLFTRWGNLIFLFSFLSAENVSREDLISTYKVSCEKHGTFPLPHILSQLQVGTYPTYKTWSIYSEGSYWLRPLSNIQKEYNCVEDRSVSVLRWMGGGPYAVTVSHAFGYCLMNSATESPAGRHTASTFHHSIPCIQSNCPLNSVTLSPKFIHTAFNHIVSCPLSQCLPNSVTLSPALRHSVSQIQSHCLLPFVTVSPKFNHIVSCPSSQCLPNSVILPPWIQSLPLWDLITVLA